MATTFEIFPSIGIARLGTSDAFFIGPEPDVPLDLRRRDTSGRVLRQAARFRVFRCERDATGLLTNAQELSANDATIRWTVHLVNRKSAAPRFNGVGRRNNATGNDVQDHDLIIDPGARSITGPGTAQAMDTGKFKGVPVPLGHLEVDPLGRLVVLGGFGNSSSPSGALIRDFADNDDWHDDISDGPVTATVSLVDGSTVEALPSWVIIAPPDFAPEITNLVTLYDVLLDQAIAQGQLQVPNPVSFEQHVKPILLRALGYQWVNRQARQGFDDTQSGAHGPDGSLGNFASAMAILGDPNPAGNGLRQRIFRLLRNPSGPSAATIPAQKRMPRLNDENDSGDVLPLTSTQYRAMQLWSQGQFVKTGVPQGELLPDALTRTALEACAGGAFFPGIEAGRILRETARYMQGMPFRLSLAALMPGEVTQRNAVPWQADFHLCRWEDGGKQLGWWPAQRPDDILKDANGSPVPWARGLADTPEALIANWHRLGFVKRDPANSQVFIEQDRDPTLSETGPV